MESLALPGQKTLTPEALASSLRGKMHALVICLSHSWGGLEQVAARDALDAARLGLDMRVMCLRDSPTHQHLVAKGVVKTEPLDFRPGNYFDFKLRAEILKQLDAGVNLVHTHQTSILGSLVPWLWRRPRVAAFASRHIMNSHNKKDFLHGAIYRRLDGLIVMSQTLRKNVLDTHLIRERSVKVVNLGLDFDYFDPSKVHPEKQREEWGADPETIVIGLVGRIDPAKGQDTFVKAAAGLLKTAKPEEKLKFVIVGEQTLGGESTHLQELQEIIRQFRIEDRIVFAGFRENVPEVMRAFDIFVMPSRQEAFGLVAIEAMAMERPVVVSRGGSADEIVGSEQQFGLMVRPNDAFDLQRRLRYLLDHPQERVEMGRRGRQHVRQNYDRKARLAKTLELYERALRRRKAI